MVSYFLSADWSKSPRKRSVYIADRRKRRIRRGKPSGASWDLGALLETARDLSQDGPVLIGIDAILGVPEGYWRSVLDERWRCPPETFVDWLSGLDVSGEFFETVVDPDDWSVARPWFTVSPGAGGRTSFTSKVNGGMCRRIDIATGGNPLFAVSGMAGIVGSGTRELWKELIPHLTGDRLFAIWPFEGDLAFLLESSGLVICETYPRLAYAAALAESLPTERMAISKTNWESRNGACDRLAQAEWVRANRIDLGDLGGPRAESASRVIHGVVYPCPIPGCDKVFSGSRGGWDAHVGSVRLHPEWRPRVGEPEERKRLFREEFRDWFE